jgi:DNA-binding transcriptional ArsR family regulator
MLAKSDDNALLGEGCDKILEHRTRLAITVLLSRHEEISFRRFKELLKESDGNLGAQLKKLEDNDYVIARKEFVDRKPVTWYLLSKTGKAALKKHIEALEKMFADLK